MMTNIAMDCSDTILFYVYTLHRPCRSAVLYKIIFNRTLVTLLSVWWSNLWRHSPLLVQTSG